MSFSGLKTAVALEIERAGGADADLAASFQEAVCDVLCEKTRRALDQTGLRRLALVGGLAANSRLRVRMAELGTALGVEVRTPPTSLCTDNAAMIAAVADGLLTADRCAPLHLEAFSRIRVGADFEVAP
jgi:N6-L-threonylcarbamoyladenine synthase